MAACLLRLLQLRPLILLLMQLTVYGVPPHSTAQQQQQAQQPQQQQAHPSPPPGRSARRRTWLGSLMLPYCAARPLPCAVWSRCRRRRHHNQDLLLHSSSPTAMLLLLPPRRPAIPPRRCSTRLPKALRLLASRKRQLQRRLQQASRGRAGHRGRLQQAQRRL